jgi:hypothetical protein
MQYASTFNRDSSSASFSIAVANRIKLRDLAIQASRQIGLDDGLTCYSAQGKLSAEILLIRSGFQQTF